MKKNQNNEELQSRREFFKKAAKSALPIFGAIVLAGTPGIVKAAEKEPMDCVISCSNGCSNYCTGQCQYGCSGGCKNGCQTTCYTGCSNTCHGSCSGGCARSAYA